MISLDSIGERIRDLRKKKGLSQEELAEAIDISVKHLSKIERDDVSFSVSILLKLSQFFKVSTDYILMGRDTEISKERLHRLIDEIYFLLK